MNYDPIHDTYAEPVPGTVPPIASVVPPVLQASQTSPTPPHSALSISSLVSVPPQSSTQEEDDHNETEDDTEDGSKRKKRKYNNSTVPKCRHLKKADGEPFWRKDIQYDFLHELFTDTNNVFTNTFPPSNITNANNASHVLFGDLYVRTMAESSKCSKILKERLIKHRDLGVAVSKVCLLVNAGRMNTTINFVPEMRSSLRTYHSIPSLQADPDGGSRPLQDTPRLKSILKAVSETGESVIRDLSELWDHPSATKPNTNVIQLIFLLANYHSPIPFDDNERAINTFMDYFLNLKIYPKCRAKRFLWLLYTYLETNLQPEEMAKNPFGGATIPPIEYIPDDELESFDRDTDYEIAYSESMYKSRLSYLADEEHNNTPKRGNKSKKEANGKSEGSEADNNGKKKKGGVSSSPLVKSTNPDNDVDETGDEASKDYDKDDEKEGTPPSGDFIKNQYQKLNTKLDSLEFPIEDLSRLVEVHAPSDLVPTDANLLNTVSSRNIIVSTSKPMVAQVRTSSKASTASFNKKTVILGSWLYRYFRYKKTIGNKLLGMEWEDIRSDLIHGVEDHLYRQNGQTLTKPKSEEMDDEPPSSWIPVDENGISYLSTHEFNSANEKNMFLLQLVTFCNEWFVQRLNENLEIKHDRVVFDLEGKDVKFV